MMAMRSVRDGVRMLEVAPVQDSGGVRKVISHDAKHYRGLVTRVLLAAETAPATAEAGRRRRDLAGVSGRGGSRLGVELDGDRLVVVDRVD